MCDALWLCWGGKKILQFFLSDTKLASREKAKLCFKAVRCKNSEGRFSFEWGNTSEGEYSWDVVYCSWVWCWNNAFSFYPLENYTFADIVFGNEQVSYLVQLHILSLASSLVKSFFAYPIAFFFLSFHKDKLKILTPDHCKQWKPLMNVGAEIAKPVI